MRTFLLLAALALVPPATAQEKAPEGDLGKLQGQWKTLIGPEKNIPLVVTIKDKTITAVLKSPQGEDFTLTGELKLDEKASPKTIDWINFKTPAGDETQPNYGLYKFEGDKWVVCNGGPGNPRPKEMKAGQDGPPNLIEFERVKPEPKP